MTMKNWGWLGVVLLAGAGGVFLWRGFAGPAPPSVSGPPLSALERLDGWEVVASVVALLGAGVLGAALHREGSEDSP
jgi:hypothetical protein